MGLKTIGLKAAAMNLSPHDQIVLQKLARVGWISQYDLRTSRQTLIKLQRANLVERKIVKGKIRYLLESSALYRLKNMDDGNVEKTNGNAANDICATSLRNIASA